MMRFATTGFVVRLLMMSCPLYTGCMATKMAIGNDVKSPVVIGDRMHVGTSRFTPRNLKQTFESVAQQQFVVAGSQGGSGWRREWQNDLVSKANWAVQGSARRAIKSCEISARGAMLNLFFLIADRQRTVIRGEVVEIERPDEGFEDLDQP